MIKQMIEIDSIQLSHTGNSEVIFFTLQREILCIFDMLKCF